MAIDDRVSKTIRRMLNAESMSATAPTFFGFASLILPVLLLQKSHIHSPDNDYPVWLNDLGGID